jgi:hypothetical protein
MKAFLFIIIILSFPGLCLAQDDWDQKLDGWVDDVYYPYLFLGGSFYTRISLADIDGDGDLDLFYGGGDSGSLVYLENIGDEYNPIFELSYEEFPGLTNWEYNYYGGTVDVDFADLDNDGDLDTGYSGNLNIGGSISWNDGTAIIPDYGFRHPLGPGSGGSSVTLVDIDNDGDYDYFSGHGNYPHQLIFARNYGSPDSAYFLHQGDTHNYQDLFFSRPFNFDMADIDNDDDVDLLVCKPHGPVAFYENTGTPDSAYFTHITDDFLPGRDTTDWTESPELADIDGDGDLDLFLAGGYAHLFYFENTGTPELYNYVQRYDTTLFYVQLFPAGARLKNSVDIDNDGDDDLAPGYDLLLNESTGNEIRFAKHRWMVPSDAGCFADMDGDGDFDFVAPMGYATIYYYENSGTPSWPEWEDPVALFPQDGRLEGVFTLGVGDLDHDGDYDLLVGHDNSSSIDYYRNDGTSQVWDFAFTNQLDLDQWDYNVRYNLLLGDIDDDDDLDLLIGDTSTDYDHPKMLFFYRNDGTPEEAVWTYVTDDFQNASGAHRNSSIIPCLADLDKDGDKDLVLTNNAVGLQLFLNPRIPTDIEESAAIGPDQPSIIFTYPNPFNQSVTFKLAPPATSQITIDIYNILGRRVESLSFSPNTQQGITWDAGDNPSGVYFYRVHSDGNQSNGKLILLK